MEKDYAISLVKKEGTMALIRKLIYEGNTELALEVIEDCFGYDDDDTCEIIEYNWDF